MGNSDFDEGAQVVVEFVAFRDGKDEGQAQSRRSERDAARADIDAGASVFVAEEKPVGFLPCRVDEGEPVAGVSAADAKEMVGFLRIEEEFGVFGEGAIKEVAARFHYFRHRGQARGPDQMRFTTEARRTQRKKSGAS